MEVRVPFSGFYESKWSREIDEEEERLCELLKEKHGVDVGQILWRATTYRDAYVHVAKAFVPLFADELNSEFGTGLALVYTDMTSPREYNFETDRVFAEITYVDALRLARKVGRHALRKAAKDMFTSRSGFISHYRNDVAEWGPLRTWDHNQLYCLLQAAVNVMYVEGEDEEWSIFEEMVCNGVLSTAYHNAVDFEEVMLEVGKLVGRKEAAEEAAEEADDGRRFPVAYADTADYIKRYEAMNQGVSK